MIDNTFTLISRIDGEIRRFITEELAAEGIAPDSFRSSLTLSQ